MKTGILFGMGLGMVVGAYLACYCPKVNETVKNCTTQVENMVCKKGNQDQQEE